MISLKNLSNVETNYDFELAPGVWFSENKWIIQYRQSEHITINFDYELGEHGHRLTDYPDLLFFHKALAYYAMPKLVKMTTTSFNSTLSISNYIKKIILCFFHEQQFVNKTLIGALIPTQFLDFIDDSITLAETLGDKADLNRLNSAFRFIRHWHEISAKALLPIWCTLKYHLEDICPQKKVDVIYKLMENRKSSWQPLDPNVIKNCYDEAKKYLNDYSTSIIMVHNLIRSRPTIGKKGNEKLAPVRIDGKTKELFTILKEFKIPTIDDSETHLFELPIITKRVKTLGYACGYQDRTHIMIEEIRPHVINLKRACIFIIGLFTGMRRREIAELRAKKAYKKNGKDYLDIIRFKTSDEPNTIGKPDSIPVTTMVAEAIDVLFELFKDNRMTLESDFLLVTDIITNKKFEKIKVETVSKDIRAFVSDFGGETAHAHQLRKTIAWLLISRSEGNVELIRQLFGHKSYKMTVQYILRNELMVDSIIELIEHNYTEDLHEALVEITEGKTAGNLSDNIKKRNKHKNFKGQILVTDIETFIHEAMQSGMNIFVSRIPIGGFCISMDDYSKKRPPCMERSGAESPQPQFCDYKSCPYVLHNATSISNIKKQVNYYQTKLTYLDESASEEVVHFYEQEVEDNLILIARLEGKNTVNQDPINYKSMS
jgi:hypothetical protein